jgi:hypothetical protein
MYQKGKKRKLTWAAELTIAREKRFLGQIIAIEDGLPGAYF